VVNGKPEMEAMALQQHVLRHLGGDREDRRHRQVLDNGRQEMGVTEQHLAVHQVLDGVSKEEGHSQFVVHRLGEVVVVDGANKVGVAVVVDEDEAVA